MIDRDHKGVEDAQLITLAQRGDTDAFGRLYERYVEQIFRYVRARVSDDRDAEDLTESVFVRSYEALENYEERGYPYSSFLYQVARNVLVDHYRRHDENQSLDSVEPLPGNTPDLEQKIVEQEQVGRIQEALAELPPDYQEVIRLRVMLSLPTATAAAWLDRSEGAVRVLLYRALKALREKVAEQSEGT